MDTTIVSVLATGAGTAIAVVGLVSRSIGNLRSHMDHRIDALAHANHQAHDAIGLRIDQLRSELGARIDAQSARIDAQGVRIDGQGVDLRSDLGKRIDAQGERLDSLEVRLARMGEDVAFIKGRVTTLTDD